MHYIKQLNVQNKFNQFTQQKLRMDINSTRNENDENKENNNNNNNGNNNNNSDNPHHNTKL